MSRATVAWGLALLLGLAPRAAAELVGNRLAGASPGEGDRFGSTVAVGGDYIAVGAYLSDIGGRDSGAVYLFHRVDGAWSLVSPQPLREGPGEQLGFDIAIQGRTLLVGAPFARVNGVQCGAVYEYELGSGGAVPRGRLQLPSDACQREAEIGSAVAIDGSLRAVGARGADRRAGRVYASFGDGFTRLSAPGVAEGDELGLSLAIAGGTVVAGAPFTDAAGRDSGAVYVFRSGEPAGRRLPLPDLRPGDAFGYAVSASGAEIAVGAPLADVRGRDSGAVYLRQGEGGWTLIPGGAAGDQLGVSVAIDNGARFTGARRSDVRLPNAGSVHSFSASGLGASLSWSQPEAGAELGFDVALASDVLVAGAFLEDAGGRRDAGAAYVFEEEEDLPQPELMISAENSVVEGTSLEITAAIANGEPAHNDIRVTVVVTEGTAKATIDYIPAPPTESVLTISAGQPSSEAVQIRTVQDAVCEGDEAFTVGLSNPSGARLGTSSEQRVTITDDDVQSLLITPDRLVLREGDSGSLSVRLTCQPATPVTITFVPDAGGVSPAQLTFTSTSAQSVTVTSPDNGVCAANTSYFLHLTAGVPSPGSVEVEPLNDDRRCVSSTEGACVLPDDTVVYTVKLSNDGDLPQVDLAGRNEYLIALPDGVVTVIDAFANRGVAMVDYAGNEVIWNGSIPPGEDTVEITILASLDPVPPGTRAEARGTLRFDRDGRSPLERFEGSVIFFVGSVPACSPP